MATNLKQNKLKPSTTSSGGRNLQSQLGNYKTRFQAARRDDPTDTRNSLEKLLNLEEDQNVLFDIFEILDRPRNALFTAIDEAASGGNFLEGLGSGITGETKTSGKDLLLNHTNLDDEEGKLNWVDVLGTGLDMFADPLDYILLPAKGAGVAADVSKALSRVDTATDALNVARKAGNTSDIAKASKELYRAQTVANKAQDAFKGVNKSLLYNNGKNFTTPMNIVGKGIGKAVKGGAKLADTGITKGLQALDNANATDLSRLYATAKKDITSLVDSATNIKGFTRRSRDIDAAKDLDKVMGESRANLLSKEIDDIVNILGDGTTHDDISRKLVNAIQSEKNWDLTGQDIIDRFVEGKGRALIPSQAQANEILKVLDQFGIKAKVINEDLGDIDDILKTLKSEGLDITKDELIEDLGAEIIIDNKNLKDLFMVRDALFDPTTKMVTNDLGAEQLSSFKDLVFGSKNSARINDQLLADRKFFNKNPELQKLYNDAQNAVKEHATITSKASPGLDAGSVATTDYVKASRDLTEEELKRNKKKAFDTREKRYDSSIAQSNAYERQRQLRDIVKKTSENRRLERQIYKVDEKTGELLKDSKGNYIRDDVKYKEYKRRLDYSIDSIKRNLEAIGVYKETAENIGKTGIVPDISGLPQKYQRQINKLIKQYGLQDELAKLDLEELKKLGPESREYVDKILNATDSLRKNIKNTKRLVGKPEKALKQFDDDTLRAVKNAGEAVDIEYKAINEDVKNLKTAIREANKASSKEVKNAIKEVGKAYKQGMEVGINKTKVGKQLKEVTSDITLINKTNSDMLYNLTKKLNLQEQKLQKMPTADKIYEDTLKRIDKNVEDIELLKSEQARNFFKDRFEDTFVDYVAGSMEQNAGGKKFYDALVNNLFSEEAGYFKPYQKGDEVPYGFTKISGKSLKDNFDAYKPILSDEGKALGEIFEEMNGKTFVIDKQFATALGVLSRNPNELKGLLNVFDKVNNVFKKFSTLTFGFHMRNISGNLTNIYLSGANVAQLPKYYEEAAKITKNAESLIEKAVKGSLAGDELDQFQKLSEFYSSGFADAITKGYGLENVEEATKGVLNKVSKWSLEKNNQIDAANRMALLLYAKEHPEYVAKLGKKDAVDAVKYVLFDPNNLSDIERDFMKRLMPFYTFTKQNLMFQATNLMKNTPKYTKLYKSFQNAYNDLDEEGYYQYQKESMQIPLPFTGSDGNQLFLKTNLPLSDLGEWLENPVQRLVASSTPFLKVPVEKATGVNTFTGEPLNNKTVDDFANALGISLPKWVQDSTSAAEHILNSFGLQNVSTNLLKKVTTILEASQGNASPQDIWAEIFRSVLQNTNQENVALNNVYDDLELYQNEVSRLKKQGIDIPTIREITTSNKLKVNNLKKKRASSK